MGYWYIRKCKNKNPWFGATAKWIKTKGTNMCSCNNEDEDREVVLKSAGDLIAVDWDEYGQRMRIKAGEYSGLTLTEGEAIRVAKSMLRLIESAKIKAAQNLCSN